MFGLIETDRAAIRIRRDSRQALASRLKRVFRDFPGAIVVRTERHHDPRLCPQAFCAAQGVVPLAAHSEEGVTETAFAFPVFEAYLRQLARLASESPDGWTSLPTVFWEDPDRYGGYCEMPISLAA